MEGMNRKNRCGRPPLPLQPPRSRAAPSALLPPMPSQLGMQPQLMMTSSTTGDGVRPIRPPFPQGLISHNMIINPPNQSQRLENNPLISSSSTSTSLVVSASAGTVSSGISSGTESVSVSEARAGTQLHPAGMDERRFRRLLSNRVSAHRSRLRRANYINELETQAKQLEAHIATLSPEVMVYQGNKQLLQMENDLMKQKKSLLEERLNMKNEEAEVYNNEIFRLKLVFQEQQQPNQAWMSPSVSGPADFTTNPDMCLQGWPSQNLFQQPWENVDMIQPSGWENPQDLGISVPMPEENSHK